MIHATYMSSEKEAALDLPQLGLTFLANSNSWNANGKLHNCEADAQEYWASWLLTMFLHSLAYVFQLGYWETNFKYQVFNFQVYGNVVEEYIMYQELQKMCRDKFYRIKVFQKLEKTFGGTELEDGVK